MQRDRFKLIHTLDQGYGNAFGFHKSGDLWACASTNLLHIWKGFDLQESFDIPGYIKGNIVVTDEQIKIGLFYFDTKTSKTNYCRNITESLAKNITSGFAYNSQYKIDEVCHLQGDPLLVTSISYRPSKLPGIREPFSGPTNRLLLFNFSNGALLKVIRENFNMMAYSDITFAKNNLIFTVDDVGCVSVTFTGDDEVSVSYEIKGFKPLCFSPDFGLSGSFLTKYIHFRDERSLQLVFELSQSFEKLNAICHFSSSGIIAAVNDHELQYWIITDKKFELIDETKMSGTIENIGINNKGLCFVAVAGQENFIQVLSLDTI